MRHSMCVDVMVMMIVAGSWGCKKSGSNATPQPDAAPDDSLVVEQPIDGTDVEASEEIVLDDLPVLLERSEVKLPHAIYEVRYHATEDGTTRAWAEINDFKDAEYDKLMEHVAQFQNGQIIVPPQAPGIPSRYAKLDTYTLIGGEYEEPFSAKPVGFTYFKGPSEDHIVSVAVPSKKLKDGGYYVGVVGTHEGMSFTQPASKSLDDASGEEALAHVHAYLTRTLRPEELDELPGSLTPGDLQIVSGPWLKGVHAHLALLDVVLDSSDEAADHISAVMFLNEKYEVSGLVEAPAVRTETFHIKGILKVKAEDLGYLIYENLQYEGAYTYLLTIDEKHQSKTSLIMLNGDGL